MVVVAMWFTGETVGDGLRSSHGGSKVCAEEGGAPAGRADDSGSIFGVLLLFFFFVVH